MSQARPLEDLNARHYETLLAPIYSWMGGGAEQACARARAELAELLGPASGGGHALDLGAGPGAHAVALSELGYQVTAVDSSRQLLSELRAACPAARAVCADLRQLPEDLLESYVAILCLGDTLTHLGSLEEVGHVLHQASALLAPAGSLLLSFRDYVSAGPPGSEACFVVRSDARRILTCQLLYETTHLRVTDLVHEYDGASWSVRASSYRKLRLDPDWVIGQLERHGLQVLPVERKTGMVRVQALARPDRAGPEARR